MNETRKLVEENIGDEYQSNKVPNKAQFATTQKWNDIINSFYTHMPLKKHWRNLRAHSDCFTGSEAIEWMYRHLKASPHFKHLTVNRQNAIALLQFMLKDKIFEDVRAGGENYNMKPFQSDDRLYRFCTNNPRYVNQLSTVNLTSSSNSTISLSSSSSTTNTRSTQSSLENQPNSTETTTTSILLDTTNKSTNNKSEQQTPILILPTESKSSNLVVEKKQHIYHLQNHHHHHQHHYQSSNSVNTYNIAGPTEKQPSYIVSHLPKKLEKISFTSSNSIEITKYKRLSSSNDLGGSEATTKKVNRGELAVAQTKTTTSRRSLKLSETDLWWSKVTKKMLESILRKAVLSSNLNQQKSNSLYENLWDSNDSNDQDEMIMSEKREKWASVTSPKATSNSTLKRSHDIKISLSKLLDKRAYDILQSISGANISYNCNNVNKHGVVISTKDDLPIWIIKAMQTLLNWDSNAEEEDYLKFKDVYEEIVSYYKSFKEPLLTKELSYLFMHILQILLHKPDLNFQRQGSTSSNNKLRPNKLHEQEVTISMETTANNTKMLQQHNSIVLIEQLIENLKVQLNEQQQSDSFGREHKKLNGKQQKMFNSNKKNSCSTHKILGLITTPSSNEPSKSKMTLMKTTHESDNDEAFESLEAKLIENAKLPVSTLIDNLQNMDSLSSESLLNELHYVLNCSGELLDNEQKEAILQNLLYASMNHLEDCCDDCLNTYNEIKQLLNSKQEFDEFIAQIHHDNILMQQQQQFIDADSLPAHSFLEPLPPPPPPPPLSLSFLHPKTRFFNGSTINLNNPINDFSNDYEDDDLIDIDDDDYDEFSLKKQQQQPLLSENYCDDLISISNHHQHHKQSKSPTSMSLSSQNYYDCSTLKTGATASMQKSLSDKKLHRNNSFRAAIDKEDDENTAKISSSSSQHLMRSSTKRFADVETPASNRVTRAVKDYEFKMPQPVDLYNRRNNDQFTSCGQGGQLFKSASLNFSKFDEVETETRKRKACNSVVTTSTESMTTNKMSAKSISSANLHSSFSSFLHQKSTSSLASLVNQLQNRDGYVNTTSQYKNNQILDKPAEYLSSLSLNQFNDVIKSTLERTRNVIGQKEESQSSLNLSSQIDSELFYFIINAFRLLTLMLPPGNRRKLHFLLRFLSKLKDAKQSAKYLLENNSNNTNTPGVGENKKDYEFFHFIDGGEASEKTNKLIENHKRKVTLNKELEQTSNALESIILNSFLNSIIVFEDDDKKNADELELKKKLGLKMMQIFVNNYSAIMRIPDDLMTSVKQKLNVSEKLNTESSIASQKSNNATSFPSKLSLHDFEQSKIQIDSSQILSNENQKIQRKALNILGLNDTIAFQQQQHNKKSSNMTLSTLKAGSSLSSSSDMSSFSMNQTTIAKVPSANKTIMGMGASSIAFPKFFNKKKKENVI